MPIRLTCTLFVCAGQHRALEALAEGKRRLLQIDVPLDIVVLAIAFNFSAP